MGTMKKRDYGLFSIILLMILLVGCGNKAVNSVDIGKLNKTKPAATGISRDFDKLKSELSLVPKQYDMDTAVKDGCFVINVSSVKSKPEVMDRFISDSQSGKPTSITVVQYMYGEKPSITKVIYDGAGYYGIEDNSRDSACTEESQKYQQFEFKYLKVFEKNNYKSCYLFNDNSITYEKFMKSMASSSLSAWIAHQYICIYNVNQPVFNGALEKYYDYFRDHNQIVVLLNYPYNEKGFTDDAMAAYAILSMDNYNYEKGNTKEEYNAITEKYFGKKIKNFNNGITKIIKGTDLVSAVGFSFDSRVFMILKSLGAESNGIKTAEFYTLNVSDSVLMDFSPQKNNDEIKKDLLSGNFSEYGKPFIVKMKFEEKTDKEGKMYLKYLELKKLDRPIDKIIPYGTK